MAEQAREMAAESTQGGNAPEWLQRLATALGATADGAGGVAVAEGDQGSPPPGCRRGQRESIYSAAPLSAQLRALLNRVRRRHAGALSAPGGSAPADSIRLAYQRLLRPSSSAKRPASPDRRHHASPFARRAPPAGAVATLTGALRGRPLRRRRRCQHSVRRIRLQTLADLLSSRAVSAEGRYADTG